LPPAVGSTLPLRSQQGFGLITLRGASPLTIDVLPSGGIYAVRHGPTLVNQVLPGPAEQGLFRLLLREHGIGASEPRRIVRATNLAGPGVPMSYGGGSATWRGEMPAGALRCTATLEVHPHIAAWRWRISAINEGTTPTCVDVILAQDLGLGDEAAVRNNEAYSSQYIDFLPVDDAQLGWILLARQNQPMQGGRHPWLGVGCKPRATGFCTDGSQFFGVDHRLTAEAVAVREPRLPSTRLQYECAMAALQTELAEVPPGGAVEFTLVARFLEDHPAASNATDASVITDTLKDFPATTVEQPNRASAPASVFVRAPWIHGDAPGAPDLDAWFPGPHRHVETDPPGRVLSFFCGDETHVVTGTKEAMVDRPHGHVLRSGDGSWIDDAQFGLTVYAAGIFGAQSYLGNASLARLLPVVRNALGVIRGSGQRLFVRQGESWRQLGVPSAWSVAPGKVCWIYRWESHRVEVRVWCAAALAASCLEIRVVEGPELEFLITHQLALGANEFDYGGRGRVLAAENWVCCTPAPESFSGRHLPGTCFALAATTSGIAEIGGDELLYADGIRREGPYVVFRTRPIRRGGIAQIGSTTAPDALAGLIAAARTEFAARAEAAAPMPFPLRLARTIDPGVPRMNEIIPWFNHNAAIHFSAPHGLEQYGGAAWGVRDVCQGSLEWLLGGGHFDIARRMLTAVFAQQYFSTQPDRAGLTGTWPQWFMFPPFRSIQQAHSHGDVCFWPVKALCDYVEASNDRAFPATLLGYTSPRTFVAEGPAESLWAHCDRVITHVESRFIPGTALVNYGDGDWDDTLQPANPEMRTRMISAWTVGLAYHTFRQFAELCRRSHEDARAARVEALLARMREDFAGRLIVDGVVAGFVVTDPVREQRLLLHPRDRATGIRYRLLPMTRSILAELFTPEQAQSHLAVIESELRYPDGVRLMSKPARYHGGEERLFRRAETAANVGREIGLQYVHAHLRYAEALAKVGDAELLWLALQSVNPVSLAAVVPNAAPRQANVYFSSSDADFADRYEAQDRWPELRTGRIAVRGGWRLYSSGPGLFLHKVRTCLVGIRESYGDVVFDPVLPRSLDGLVVDTEIRGVAVQVSYRVQRGTNGPDAIAVNGVAMKASRDANPYRRGGLRVAGAQFANALRAAGNRIEIDL
jgi:CRISPR-associated protein Csx3